jgi:hypothetical protein
VPGWLGEQGRNFLPLRFGQQRTGPRHRPSFGSADSAYALFWKTRPSSFQALVSGYATASSYFASLTFRCKNITFALSRILADSSASPSRMVHAFLASNRSGEFHVVAADSVKKMIAPQPMDSSSGWGAITRIFV